MEGNEHEPQFNPDGSMDVRISASEIALMRHGNVPHRLEHFAHNFRNHYEACLNPKNSEDWLQFCLADHKGFALVDEKTKQHLMHLLRTLQRRIRGVGNVDLVRAKEEILDVLENAVLQDDNMMAQ